MSFCTLGGYSFRIDPSNVQFDYSVDSVVIPTIGGRVIQVYGVTLGDLVVQGLYGQDRSGAGKESWQLAEEFQAAMGNIVKQQSAMPSTTQLSGLDQTTMHPPVRFLFNDGTRNWDFQVYVKSLRDAQNQEYTVEHATGKFSYGYTLTLFIVEDNSRVLRQVAVDKFIERLATGIGWKRTEYNGQMTLDDLTKYVKENSPDGTLHGLVLKRYQDSSSGSLLPGGAATAGAAQSALGGDAAAGGAAGGAAGVAGGAGTAGSGAKPGQTTGGAGGQAGLPKGLGSGAGG